MSYSYKGNITFGAINIPVVLYSVIKEEHVPLHLLDKKTMSKVSYKKVCLNENNKVIEVENIVKGYEYEKGKYVIFEPEELEEMKSNQNKDIMLQQFVQLCEIDPIYFKRSYFVVPSGSEEAYSLLQKAMNDEKKVAIGKTIIGIEDTLVALRSRNGNLILHTLYFQNEIQDNLQYESKGCFNSTALKLAKNLIKQMTSPFNSNLYKDEFLEKIEQAITNKIRAKEIIMEHSTEKAQDSNLIEKLQVSLEQMKKEK